MAIVQGSITAIPYSYDTVNISYESMDSSNPVGNAYADTSSTTYFRFYLKTGAQAETYIYFKFDFSSIPSNAVITSISASTKCNISSTSTAIAARQIQLSTGLTLKGSSTANGTATSTRALTPGTWTRAELDDIRMRFYAKRSSSSTTSSYYIRVYGATVTVAYEYDDSPAPPMPLRVKDNGSWVTPTKVLVKDSGSWTEATKILVKDGGEWK